MQYAAHEPMRFGMQLPIQAQSALFAYPWERSASVEDLATIARTADQAGFDYIGVCDHFAIPERLASAMSTTWYDTVATLGWLAALTNRVRLLSHVHVLAYRHPAQVAHAFATLDHLSGGRAILGVGVGHVAEEFALLGLDFARRGTILDDNLVQVKRYLENEFVDGLGASPRSVQRPRPPIWVGGSSVAAIRRAALHSEGWLPQGTPKKHMTSAVEMIRTLRSEAGRTEPFAIGSITPFLFVGGPIDGDHDGVVAGSSEQIAAEISSYRALGVTHLQVRFHANSATQLCEQIDRFAGEVVPLVS